VVEYTEDVALGVAKHDEVRALWIRPVLDSFRTERDQPLDLGPLIGRARGAKVPSRRVPSRSRARRWFPIFNM